MTTDYIQQALNASQGNKQLAVAEDEHGAKHIVSAKYTWKSHVLQTLSYVPVLKSLACVKDFLTKCHQENHKALELLLDALRTVYKHHYTSDHGYSFSTGDTIYLNTHLEKFNALSIGKPLTHRAIKQIIQDTHEISGLGKAKQHSKNRLTVCVWEESARFFGHAAVSLKNNMPADKKYFSWYPDTPVTRREKFKKVGGHIKTNSLADKIHGEKISIPKRIYLPYADGKNNLFGLLHKDMNNYIDKITDNIQNEYFRLASKTSNCAGKALSLLASGGAKIYASMPRALIAFTPSLAKNYAIKLLNNIENLNTKSDTLIASYQKRGGDTDITLEQALQQTNTKTISMQSDSHALLKHARHLTLSLKNKGYNDAKIGLLCAIKNQLNLLNEQ